jgi:hypothetical protein
LGIGLVLVLVVPNVLSRCLSFMLAITRHCSPTELHRQEDYEEDEEPTAHCGESVAAPLD